MENRRLLCTMSKGYHLCEIIFKSHYATQSYSLDTNRFHWSLCSKFKCELCPWPWTYQYGSCTLHIVLSWWSCVPNYFQISRCRTKLWADMILEYTNDKTHTHGQVRLYMPLRHFMAVDKNCRIAYPGRVPICLKHWTSLNCEPDRRIFTVSDTTEERMQKYP